MRDGPPTITHKPPGVAALLKALAGAGVSVLACLLLMEAGCRWWFSRHLDYQVEMGRYAASLKRTSPVAGMGHEHIPGQQAVLMGVPVLISGAGFRDREYARSPSPDSYRILLLGDSLTLGWGVPAEARFSDILEDRLNSEGPAAGRYARVEIINTGIGNYNTAQEVAFFLARGRSWKPDLVVLNYFINDAEPTPRETAPGLFRHSYLAMLLWGRLDILSRRWGSQARYDEYYESLYKESAKGWRDAQAAMQRLTRQCRDDGTDLLVFILPELHAIGATYGFADIHARVRSAAHAAGCNDVVDLAEGFKTETPRGLWVSPDDAHPNERAHRILAEAMIGPVKHKIEEGSRR